MSDKDFEKFRQEYQTLSFKEKQDFSSKMQRIWEQHCSRPTFFLSCLKTIMEKLNRSDVKVLELGCYDGSLALEVLKKHHNITWVGYDFSLVAQAKVKAELSHFKFSFVLLHTYFYQIAVTTEQPDVFFTSHTLEHMRLREVLAILDKTADTKFQVHTIDWVRGGLNTHVLESDSYAKIKKHLRNLGYIILQDSYADHQTYIFAERSVIS